MIEYGYHGTSMESAASILESGIMKRSEGYDEWLGKGIYFFYNQKDAEWWCQQRAYPSPAILYADFNFINKVINLVCDYNDQEKFKEYCSAVKEKSEKLPGGKRRRNYMQLAINKLLYDAKKAEVFIDAIIAVFDENRKFWPKTGNFVVKFPILIGQIQICIFNSETISNLKIINEEA